MCDSFTYNSTIYLPPNWKLDPLLNQMMRVAKYGIHIGKSISVDEMDISFQGRHKDKQRVTYKKGGDGFLVDDLCTEGYTYSWHFINQLAPRKWLWTTTSAWSIDEFI